MNQVNTSITEIQPDELERAGKLRVAFFSDSLPERNGTGAYYHDLSQQLASAVAEVRVVQPQRSARFSRLALPLPGDPTQQLMTPNVFRIRRQMRELRPHVVVSVTPGPFGLLGYYYARRYKSGFLSGFHTQFEGLAELYWRPLQRRVITGYLRGVSRFLCRRSQSVLINNSELSETVKALGARQVDVIGTPLQALFIDTPVRAWPEQVRQICYAGRLAAEKNIAAVFAAAERHSDIQFVIGGDGPERNQVIEASKRLPNLDYRGWLSRQALVDLIDDSSLLVLPSHLETFGSVALEAMARGRPALVSAKAGIHDWPGLADGLCRLEPSESLAEAIDRLVRKDHKVLQEKAGRARAAALALNQATIEHWAALLARHASKRP